MKENVVPMHTQFIINNVSFISNNNESKQVYLTSYVNDTTKSTSTIQC